MRLKKFWGVMTKGFFVRENTCPTCGYLTNKASGADGTPIMPQSGDVCVCVKCGEILRFSRYMKLHLMTEVHLNQLKVEDPLVYLDAITAQGLARARCRKKGGADYHD